MIDAIVRPLGRTIVFPPTQRRSNSVAAAMRTIFANDPGDFIDFSNFSSMYQDSAGTMPFTTSGQFVGRINGAMGRHTYIQPASGCRPVADSFGATFDGIDDGMYTTAAVNYSGTNKITIVVGVAKFSEAATGMFLELSADANANNGAFYLTAPQSLNGNSYGLRSRGTLNAIGLVTGYASPVSSVVTAMMDISAPRAAMRVDGVQRHEVLTDQGTGNFGNYVLNLGRRNNASLPFNGVACRAAILGRKATAAELVTMESWANQTTMAY